MLEVYLSNILDICTLAYEHVEIAINSFNSDNNVIVKKSMVASIEECDAMLEVAKKNNKLLLVIVSVLGQYL